MILAVHFAEMKCMYVHKYVLRYACMYVWYVPPRTDPMLRIGTGNVTKCNTARSSAIALGTVLGQCSVYQKHAKG